MFLTLETKRYNRSLGFSNTLSIQARGPTGSNPCSEPKQLTCLKYSVRIQAGRDNSGERYVGPHNKKKVALILIEERWDLVSGTAKSWE